MNAIMVAVDYTDLASITIPYNRHHFDKVYVVTAWKGVNKNEHDDALGKICYENRCELYYTDSFYTDGAIFNKWRALEEGLDHFHLRLPGWLCIMDADVLWPKSLDFSIPEGDGSLIYRNGIERRALSIGNLYSPLRHMWNEWPMYNGEKGWQRDCPITEEEWKLFPIHRNTAEWAGYSQIFHTSDPVLGPAPWHQVDWLHAGGADSAFQAKWAPQNKVRPPFECLHLGPAGKNWYGRATPFADGTLSKDSSKKLEMVDQIWSGRAGKHGEDRFKDERISPKSDI